MDPQTRPKTIEDDEHTQPTTDHEYSTNDYDEMQRKQTQTSILDTSHESTETLLDYTYRTDTEKEEEPNTLPNIDIEGKTELNTRTTRKKARRNYRDDASGRETTSQEQRRENTTKEKRTDANKTKIILLENTIIQMRHTTAALDKTREAEASAWQDTVKQMQDNETRGEAARKLEINENQHMEREINKLNREREDMTRTNQQIKKERDQLTKENKTLQKENEKLKWKVKELIEANKNTEQMDDEMVRLGQKWEAEK